MDKPIDYRSDFSFLLEIKDADGNVLPLSEVDFDGQAYTAIKPGYAFGRKEGVCRNCALQGDKVLIVCDNHGLQPGTVKVELYVHYPDELYPDGIRTEFHKVNTGITLGDGCECKPSDAIPTVTVTTPTFIRGGGSKVKAFRTSEYVCRGLIPSNAQPGNVYYCDRMKFDKLGLRFEAGECIGWEDERIIDIGRLFSVIPFDEERLVGNTPRIKWSYIFDYNNEMLKYFVSGFAVNQKGGVTPMLYRLPEKGYWYIDKNGALRQAKEPLPRKEWALYLPEDFSLWEEALRGGIYELQRRERVKKARGTEYAKSITKWVRLRSHKHRNGEFYLVSYHVTERIKALLCGVFRLRRVSNQHHGTKSPWVYFTTLRQGAKVRIKKL